MNRFLYSLLITLAWPLLVLRLLWRARKAPEYGRRWGERFARRSAWPEVPADRPLVHIHAVSVGEVHAAEPLIRRFLTMDDPPALLVTTSTPTGSGRVRALFAGQVLHVYLPYDLSIYMRRFVSHFAPRLLVILETELWPNLIHHAHSQGTKTALVNARLSEKSANGYARFPALTRQMLDELDFVSAQSDADARRLVALGAAADCVLVLPSLKYDIGVPAAQVELARQLRVRLFGPRPVVIAASTREGEEELVLDAFTSLQQVVSGVALVLVPRHPERFAAVRQLVESRGLGVVTRSELSSNDAARVTDVLLGDTLGEMFFYYGLVDVAFVGGSLVDTGCQNILEPAALGLPIVTGPSLFNFRQVSEGLQQAGGQVVVEDVAGLAHVWQRLLEDRELRASAGRQAQAEFSRQSGASGTLAKRLTRLMAPKG